MLRLEVRLLGDELPHPEAVQALHQQADGAIRRAQQAMHGGDHADLVQIAGPGRFQLRVLGGDQPHQLVGGHDVVHQLDGARLAHRQRDGRLRVDHHPSQGQDGQHIRVLGRLRRSRSTSCCAAILLADGGRNARNEHPQFLVGLAHPVQEFGHAGLPAGSGHHSSIFTSMRLAFGSRTTRKPLRYSAWDPIQVHRARQRHSAGKLAKVDLHLMVGAPFACIRSLSADDQHAVVVDHLEIRFAHAGDLDADDVLIGALEQIGRRAPDSGGDLPAQRAAHLAAAVRDRDALGSANDGGHARTRSLQAPVTPAPA